MTKRSLATSLAALEELVANSEIDDTVVEMVMSEVALEYVTLGRKIPKTEAWHFGKLRDAADDAQSMGQFQARFGLSDQLTELLQLMVFSADIGRLMIRVHGGEQVNHGAVSAELINTVVPAKVKEDFLWQTIQVATTNHSLRFNPLPFDVTNPASVLTGLLRDLDMLGNWRGGNVYLEPERMQEEMRIWKFVDEPRVPQQAIADFLAGRPVERETVETYAGYMLQFLAWGYNFTYKELWQECLDSGHPKLVLNFILGRMREGGQTNQAMLIQSKAKEALGIVL